MPRKSTTTQTEGLVHVPTQDLAPAQPAGLFGVSRPGGIIAKATEAAEALSRVIESRKLFTNIGGRKHVRVEGWTLLGNLLGVFPQVAWTRPLEHDGKVFGWEARAEARTMAGVLVGAAEAMCTKAEKTWAGRDSFALRSMAQTRAISKALRLPLGFVVTLAGYDATPDEEMPSDLPREQDPAPVAQPSQDDARERGLRAVNALVSDVFGSDREAFYRWLDAEGRPAPMDPQKGRPSIALCGVQDLRAIYEALDMERRLRARPVEAEIVEEDAQS